MLRTAKMRVAVKEQCHRIDASLLIPGRGDPIHDGTLIFSGKTILYAGSTSDLPDQHARLEPVFVPVLMPGLWDSHVHFLGAPVISVDLVAATAPAVAGMRTVRDAAATLNAGFTSVREVAGYGVQMAQVIDEGWMVGPTIYSSVAMLSQTAGHGDTRAMPASEYQDRISHGLPAHVCDGPVECTKAVRTMIRKGAKVIKLSASGGVLSTGDDIGARQFSDEELEAIVAEANRNSLNVAAHCHAKEAVTAALRAGVHTIEHGTCMDDECIDLILKKKAMYVATRSVLAYVTADPNLWTPEQYEALLEMDKRHCVSYRKAVKAGVTCALGTDLGASSTKSFFNHGTNGTEFKHAVEAGMTPLQAIEAGTANGPLTLGGKAPKSGQLREGYDADFIALDSSPIDDISILADPKKITHVWKGGKLFKSGGRTINILEALDQSVA